MDLEGEVVRWDSGGPAGRGLQFGGDHVLQPERDRGHESLDDANVPGELPSPDGLPRRERDAGVIGQLGIGNSGHRPRPPDIRKGDRPLDVRPGQVHGVPHLLQERICQGGGLDIDHTGPALDVDDIHVHPVVIVGGVTAGILVCLSEDHPLRSPALERDKEPGKGALTLDLAK